MAETAQSKAPPGERTLAQVKSRRLKAVRTWVGRIGIAAIALLMIAAIVAGALPKPVPVDVGRVQKGDLRIAVREDGRSRVKDRYTISSPLAGNLARVEMDPGDQVKKGQVVLRLLPLDAPLLDTRSKGEAAARLAAAQAAAQQARASVGRAQAALEQAQREAQRNEQLSERGAIAAQALDRSKVEERTRREEASSAQFGVRVADHQVEMARAAAERMTGRRLGAAAEGLEVTSPIEGRVLRVLQQSGGVVQPGTALLEVGDPAALEIVVDVLTQDAIQVRKGAAAIIERWGGPDELKAHVRLVEPSAFTRLSALGVEEQRVNVVLDLDEPQQRWAALGDGYRVEARIMVWEGKGVISAPLSAVFRDGEHHAVFVLQKGRAALRRVVLGQRGDLEAEVKEGLREGEAVVLHPSDQVKPGVKLERR